MTEFPKKNPKDRMDVIRREKLQGIRKRFTFVTIILHCKNRFTFVKIIVHC
jgi:hypothetical protein